MSAVPHELGIRCEHFLSMAGGRAETERDVYLGVRDGRIAEVRPWAPECAGSARRLIDGRGKVAMPGLVNGHAHLAMTLFRGLNDDLPFHRWLFDSILPLEAKLVNEEFVRAGTALAALESIRFGVTTLNEMYYYAEAAAETIDAYGLRALVAQAFVSAPTPEDRDLGADKRALFERLHVRYSGHERIVPALGPHAPYTVTDELWREVVRLRDRYGAPIQTHLSETAHEVAESRRLHGGESPVQRLSRLGVLSRGTICAHCVHLDEADTELLRASGASISHNPDSNLKLGSGIAPVTRYLRAGIPVALGTDGAAANNDLNLFGAMDLAAKLQKLTEGDDSAMTASAALRAATWDGARALGLLDRIGSLEVGKDADLILVDLNFPHLQPLHDVRSHLVYATGGLEVDTVLCRGRVLLEGKRFAQADPSAVYAAAALQGERLRAAAVELAGNANPRTATD